MAEQDVKSATNEVLAAYAAREQARKTADTAAERASETQQAADNARAAYDDVNNTLHNAGEALKKAVDDLISPPATPPPPAAEPPRVDVAS